MLAEQLSRTGNELWAWVPGFYNLYQVSNLGRVKSVQRSVLRSDGVTRSVPERILKAAPDAYGYPRVTLYRNGNSSYWKVAEIVYTAFKGNYSDPVLRHLDDNKENSALHNLLPGTYSENLRDAVSNGKHTLGYGSKLLPKEVADIKRSLLDGLPGKMLADHYGVSPQTISGIKSGKRYANIRPTARYG